MVLNLNFKFENKKITGILSIIPKNEVTFDEEIDNYNFSKKRILKLKKIMGYDKHRIVNKNTCISDLCIYGMNYLFNQGLLVRDEIDALILVTQTPDYFIPPTSFVLQGKLGLRQEIYCLDINQGCAGFIIGLIESFNLLNNKDIKKVVLINADVLSRKVSNKDRNSYPLIGDGASITIIENDVKNSKIYVNIKNDGCRSDVLIIPAGGMKMPSTSETSILEEDEEGNFRSKDHLKMDGRAVFNFVQTEVPPLIDDLINKSQINKENIEYYLFHQPNKFMLQKLADKMGVSRDKMPNNIVENFGNSSGATIPLNITFNLGQKLINNEYMVCLTGFGVGLTWGSMLMNIGNFKFCNIIEY